MSEYLTTRELADLLRIKERKVYDLAASGTVPCLKATGKLLFPRLAVEEWLARHGSGEQAATASRSSTRPNVFLGSHDPLLEWALRQSQCGLATYFDGSSDGLDRFGASEGIATGLHLYDPGSDDWNTPVIAARFGGSPVVLVEWAKRRRGLVIAERHQASVKAMRDLKGLTIAPRQAESGTHVLFNHLLGEAGLAIDAIKLTEPARTEVDAALAVLDGKADGTFGLEAVARQYRLPFVPLIEERFDLLVDRRAWFEPPMQKLLVFCRSKAFADRAKETAGYDLSNFGAVHFNGA